MQREAFIKNLASELAEGNLAVFIGAGLSVASGGVTWSVLLENAAKELDLEIDREHDLISLTQFYINSKNQNKGGLAQHIFNTLNLRDAEPNENHRLLAKMPIRDYWTTNFDKLIEKSLEDENRLPDVKYDVSQFTRTLNDRDAIVYKMHGDIEHPKDVVITRADFEKYQATHNQFLNALYGDLTTKTFLFLGLSFTDPNLFYVLSRVRVQYQTGQREHYAIMKRFERKDFENDDDFQYALKRQPHFVNDLINYHISVLLVDSHEETTDILRQIEKIYRRNTIFISGSAIEYGSHSSQDASNLIEAIVENQFKRKRRIINGYGLGFGDLVVGAAVRKISTQKFKTLNEYVLIRPFPQTEKPGENLNILWEEYRRDMISRAGIAIFMYGNKIDKNSDKCINADGVYKEFQISRDSGLSIIPIGATGYMSKVIWEEVKSSFDEFYPGATQKMRDDFELIGTEKNIQKLGEAVNRFIQAVYDGGK